jgi:hypothetical protein
MKKNLAQRMREKRARKLGIAPVKPAPSPVAKDSLIERRKDVEELFSDASEVEQEEKQARKRRPRKPKATDTNSSKPKRSYTRRDKDED